jgi:hypothetical protein
MAFVVGVRQVTRKPASAETIDGEAFKKQLNIPDARNQQVKLPKVKDVPLGEVLKKLVHQIGGTFQIQNSQVKIVPNTM